MQIGDRVRFRKADVFLPAPDAVLAVLPEELELEGTVTDFSDSGSTERAFAVVNVVRKQAIIVPLDKVQVISPFGQPGSA